MIKVNIFYPNGPDVKFDMAYYCDKHMPMVKDKLGAACVGWSADAGLAGGAPGQPATYVAIGALLCTSAEAFGAAMAPKAGEIMADIPNYTNSTPVLQISEVKVG